MNVFPRIFVWQKAVGSRVDLIKAFEITFTTALGKIKTTFVSF